MRKDGGAVKKNSSNDVICIFPGSLTDMGEEDEIQEAKSSKSGIAVAVN